VKDAQPLGKDSIHSVSNPPSKFTAAIHVYGGDFFATDRSEWDADTLSEQPCGGNRAPDLRGRQPALCRELELSRLWLTKAERNARN
jgi:hypothetical protein